MTIDMKNFTGELSDPAAEGQQILANSYQDELTNEEFPVIRELLEPPVEAQPKVEAPQEVFAEEPSKQELNFKALREEVDRIKAERDEFKQNIELLKANSRQQEQYRPPVPEKKLFDGMEEGDIPNVAEIRKAWADREAEYLGRIEELSVAQQHSDYAEVLEKYTAPLIKQKPHLVEGIQGARNKALFAYELGKLYQNQQQAVSTPPPPQPVQQPTSPSATAQRIVENSRKPGTLSSSGGQGALSKADFIATMSDRDFMEMASKHLDQI